MYKKTRKAFSILGIIIAALIIVALIAFISTTLVRASKKANFYLVNDGVQIRESGTEVVLEKGEKETFYLAYFEDYEGEKQEYTVSVECIPDGENFYFRLNSSMSSFYAMRPDVTEYFDIKTEEDSFSITLDKKFKITDLIKEVYDTKQVTYPSEVDCSKTYLMLVVRLADGTLAYEIPFRCVYEIEDVSIKNSDANRHFGGEMG